MKQKPKVKMQDFHTTLALHNDTWTVMLCPKSPGGLWNSVQLVLQVKAWLTDCWSNTLRWHWAKYHACKAMNITHFSCTHSDSQLCLWIKKRMNKNARTHTETFSEDVVWYWTRCLQKEEFIDFLFLLLCEGRIALQKKTHSHTAMKSHKNTDISSWHYCRTRHKRL